MGVLLIAALPMLPYWISGYQSRRRVNYGTLGFWIFCTFILIGTGIAGYLYLFAAVMRAGFAAPLALTVTQILAYLYATGSCLGNQVTPTA